VCHRGFDRPVVFITEGYSAFHAERSDYRSELGALLKANEIVVEHRFFGESVPADTGWQYLTVENAAGDHHRIIEMMKKLYPGKWISSGISKGGQTALFHRTFYPEDVDATVGYVCPLNFSDEDLRVYEFLEGVGDSACRNRVRDYQLMLLENRETSLEAFKKKAKGKGESYSMGWERAFELMVLEYSFAFWQWGNVPCEAIPDESSSSRQWIDHLDRVAGLDWVSDKGIARNLPFFYQAITEIGMYGYDLEPFGELIRSLDNNTFSFTCPRGVECTYNPEIMERVDYYVRHEARNVMVIYGEYDPWSATAVQWSGNPGLVKIIKPRGSHLTRIGNLPEDLQEKVNSILDEWIEDK